MPAKKKPEQTYKGYLLCAGFTADDKPVHGFIHLLEDTGIEEVLSVFNSAHGEKPDAVLKGFTVKEIEP